MTAYTNQVVANGTLTYASSDTVTGSGAAAVTSSGTSIVNFNGTAVTGQGGNRGVSQPNGGALTVNVDATSTVSGGNDGIGSNGAGSLTINNQGGIETATPASGSNSGVYIDSGAALTLVNSGVISAGAIGYGVNANTTGAVRITNSGTITSGGSSTGDALHFAGADNVLTLSAGGTAGTITGGILFDGALSIDPGTTAGNSVTLANLLQGAGALTKTGAGTLTLTNANTYSGGTTISTGTLVKQNTGAALGSGTVAIATGATLELNAGANNFDQNGITFTGTGTITKTGADSVAFGNHGDVNVNLSAGALIDVQAGSLSGSASNQGIWTNNFASLNIASAATFNADLARAQYGLVEVLDHVRPRPPRGRGAELARGLFGVACVGGQAGGHHLGQHARHAAAPIGGRGSGAHPIQVVVQEREP